MAYIDRRPNPNRPAIIAAVAVIHGLAIYAIVTGLAANIVPEIITRVSTYNTPVEPPSPAPEPQASARPKTDPNLIAPETDLTIPRPREPFVVPARPLPNPVPDPGPSQDFVAPADPPSPTPSFKPIGAKPKTSPANWVTTNDYPSRDLREGNQGIARFSLAIGTDGKVESCVVTKSSGSSGLDEATCRLVTRRAKFEPATDADGAKVTGSYSGSIRWEIPE